MSQLKAPIADAASVDAAIENRFCVRAFSPAPVPRQSIEAILRVASRSPSGTNAQPWQVYVLQGASRDALVDKVCAAYDEGYRTPAAAARFQEEYDYYPKEWISPFVDRRRKVGWDLYSLLDITKGDKARMHEQNGRNFRFFDAPVGMIFTIDRVMGKGSLLDYGMFLENIMVAARARGLDTCPQAAFNAYHALISEHLGLDAEREMVVVGMALGHADPQAIENSLLSERVPVSDFATFWP